MLEDVIDIRLTIEEASALKEAAYSSLALMGRDSRHEQDKRVLEGAICIIDGHLNRAIAHRRKH